MLNLVYLCIAVLCLGKWHYNVEMGTWVADILAVSILCGLMSFAVALGEILADMAYITLFGGETDEL